MIRDVDIAEISDGKLYRSSDMAKCDTLGCKNCGECCHAMDGLIILDPYDIWRFAAAGGLSFDDLMNGHAELVLADGLTLPALTMNGPFDACSFLDPDGRCRVHRARPGICRLFPLGRVYQDRDFRYFLQVNQCGKARSKIRISKWMDTPDLPRYEQYIRDWHFFLKDVQEVLAEDESKRHPACLYILQLFYRIPWDTAQDFYPQFEKKLAAAKETFDLS